MNKSINIIVNDMKTRADIRLHNGGYPEISVSATDLLLVLNQLTLESCYNDAIVASNELGYVGMSAEQVIRCQGQEIAKLKSHMNNGSDITGLSELAVSASSAITRLSANGEDCLYAVGDDLQIDKDVELSNKFYKAFSPVVVISLLYQIEKLRQRADVQKALNTHLDLAVRQSEGVNANLRRRAEKAEAEITALKGSIGAAKDWEIDHSAGVPILVYKKCSVIESEAAYGLLELIKKSEMKATDLGDQA